MNFCWNAMALGFCSAALEARSECDSCDMTIPASMIVL